jgi:Mce-associated membrane protein
VAVLAAAVVAAAAYFAVPAWRSRAVQEAQRTAPSVAERAAKAILSYDYRSLTRDEKTAASYLTPAYATKYRRTFDRGVRPGARRLHAKVTARVLDSGIAQADADHAHVLLFVDQTTRSKANPGRPQVALNRVMLDLVRRGDTWLVNDITAY